MLLRSKYPKNLKYQIEAQWDGKQGGSAESKNGSRVKFDIPITFNGPGKAFCPDELLAASVAGCLMNTFLHFCMEMKLEFELRLTAKVEKIAYYDSDSMRKLMINDTK